MTTLLATRPEGQDKESSIRVMCHHHWMLPVANAPFTEGICRLCSARRNFSSHLQDCLKVAEKEYEKWLARQRHKSEAKGAEDLVPAVVRRGREQSVALPHILHGEA